MQQFFSCVRGRAGRPARPRTQHGYHHDTKVKPEAATAVVERPKMGEKTPETCWVVNKRQDNKLKNYCIWLVIYLNYGVCLILYSEFFPLVFRYQLLSVFLTLIDIFLCSSSCLTLKYALYYLRLERKILQNVFSFLWRLRKGLEALWGYFQFCANASSFAAHLVSSVTILFLLAYFGNKGNVHWFEAYSDYRLHNCMCQYIFRNLLTHSLTYLLTPWSRVLLEMTDSQLVKKFPTYYGTRRFITAFTSACHLSLFWARSIQSLLHFLMIYLNP